jgi:predicted GIY-YIG superfamily endonuclease
MGPSFRWEGTESGEAVVTDSFYVYLLASRTNGTLYVGVTSDLFRRITEHREHVVPSFASKYRVTRLVRSARHDAGSAATRASHQSVEAAVED